MSFDELSGRVEVALTGAPVHELDALGGLLLDERDAGLTPNESTS